MVLTAKGLRCHATGTHTEKAKQPIDRIEHHGANRDSGNILLGAHVPDNGQIGQAKQGNGNIAYDRWHGQPQNILVSLFHRFGFFYKGS